MKAIKRLVLLASLLTGLSALANHTESWEQVNFDIWQGATDWSNADYLRSVDAIDSSKVIENYRLGDDGFMYVGVTRGGELQGYFRYLYDFTSLPGGPTDPFGDPLHNIPSTFDPPGGDSWYDPDLNYRDIAWTPEPEAYTGAFGASLVGVCLWLRRRKAHGVTPQVTRPPSRLRASRRGPRPGRG